MTDNQNDEYADSLRDIQNTQGSALTITQLQHFISHNNAFMARNLTTKMSLVIDQMLRACIGHDLYKEPGIIASWKANIESFIRSEFQENTALTVKNFYDATSTEGQALLVTSAWRTGGPKRNPVKRKNAASAANAFTVAPKRASKSTTPKKRKTETPTADPNNPLPVVTAPAINKKKAKIKLDGDKPNSQTIRKYAEPPM